MMTYPEEEVSTGSVEEPAESNATALPTAMSPYPTGGGGVTFERKVAVQYLAHLLVGDGAVALGRRWGMAGPW